MIGYARKTVEGSVKGVSGWLYLSPLVFGIAVLASVVAVNVLIVPGGLWHLAGDPWILAWLSVPTAFCAFLAAYLWLRKGIGFFGGWLSVGVAAWIPLLVNPVAWLLSLRSFMLFGFVVLGCLLLAGAVLQVVWECRRK